MNKYKFAKGLSSNDVGETGSHQAGIHVPKKNRQLLAFFPQLKASQKNPDVWLTCVDAEGKEWRLRYVYYNNELHDPKGTRNEYRITHVVPFLKQEGAHSGDSLVLESTSRPLVYRISIEKASQAHQQPRGPIQLRGWRQIH